MFVFPVKMPNSDLAALSRTYSHQLKLLAVLILWTGTFDSWDKTVAFGKSSKKFWDQFYTSISSIIIDLGVISRRHILKGKKYISENNFIPGCHPCARPYLHIHSLSCTTHTAHTFSFIFCFPNCLKYWLLLSIQGTQLWCDPQTGEENSKEDVYIYNLPANVAVV